MTARSRAGLVGRDPRHVEGTGAGYSTVLWSVDSVLRAMDKFRRDRVARRLAEKAAHRPRSAPVRPAPFCQPRLAGTPSPGPGHHRGGHHRPLSHPVDLGEQSPGVAISPVRRNERAGIEHPRSAGGFRRRAVGCQAARALAAAMSSSVMGPASASYSAMAAARRSRARRFAAARAIPALTPRRPARARTSSTRSPGRVTVSRGISRSIAAK